MLPIVEIMYAGEAFASFSSDSEVFGDKLLFTNVSGSHVSRVLMIPILLSYSRCGVHETPHHTV